MYQKLPFEIPEVHAIYWNYWRKYGRYRQRSGLYFEVHVVDHCNLNCCNCNHYSPLSKPWFIDIADFEKDIQRMARIAGNKVDTIRLLGGEPLLHNNLISLIETVRKYFPDKSTRLQILTNGVLLKKQEDAFWKTCKTANTDIMITYYPINLDIAALEVLAKKWGVSLSYVDYNPQKNKTMFSLALDKTGEQDMRISFQKCPVANTCATLKDGKIYQCAIAAHINIFNEYFGQNFSLVDDDYIDIYKAKKINEIFEFLNNPVPFCRYCTHKYEETRTEWKITKKEISEWVE
jgi:MoaA/NifB/PqqE/SkfB family radical SAM enzyme